MAVRRTRKKLLTKAQRLARERAIIKDLRAGKLSYRKIATKHKVSLPTVNAKARKAGISRRPGTRVTARTTRPKARAKTRIRSVAKRTTRKATTRGKVRARTTKKWTARSSDRFNEQFRELVMSYYPSMPLAKFERLTKQINKAIS